jgi:hypothetical protein
MPKLKSKDVSRKARKGLKGFYQEFCFGVFLCELGIFARDIIFALNSIQRSTNFVDVVGVSASGFRE